MATLGTLLEIQRCPHCGIDSPNLVRQNSFQTYSPRSNIYNEPIRRTWGIYSCQRCGGVVTASADHDKGLVKEIYPKSITVDENIPVRARNYLSQALDSINAPSGAVMLAASAVDSMLKDKGMKDGSLYSRINKAMENHLITEEMSKWAHEVRLDANGERHADEKEMPTPEDAKRVIDFALALGEFLFVLPSRVNRGIQEATDKS